MLKANLKTEQTDRLVRGLSRLGLSPNGWTLLSLLPAIAGLAVLAAAHSLVAGLVLFVLSGFIDISSTVWWTDTWSFCSTLV
jgi:hypothetical protein